MVVKLSDFLTTSLVLTSLDSADVIRVMRNSTIGIDSNTTGDFVSSITGGTGITATGSGHAAAATISVDNTVVTTDSSQTLTNKTFNLTNNTLQATFNQLNAAVSGATLVSLDGAETLTNKTLTTPTINGGSFSSGSIVDISTFGLRDVTTTAYETRIRSNNASPILTADRTLSLDVNNADRTISLTGNLTLGGSFTTSGAHNTSFITSGNTSLNLPTSGTLLSYNDSNAASITGAFSAGTLTGKYLGFDSDFTAKSTTDLSEGTNLYYTTARADSAFDDRLATKSTTNLSEGTNLYYLTSRADSDFDVRLTTKSTSNLAEGSNLYYTTARADSAFDVRLTTKSTTNLAEGSNLYYTTARVDSDFDVRLTTKSTTNLTEGSNLYYTTVRVDSDISAAVTKTFVDALNVDADSLDGQDGSYYRIDVYDASGTLLN